MDFADYCSRLAFLAEATLAVFPVVISSATCLLTFFIPCEPFVFLPLIFKTLSLPVSKNPHVIFSITAALLDGLNVFAGVYMPVSMITLFGFHFTLLVQFSLKNLSRYVKACQYNLLKTFELKNFHSI